jgi:hypothetical protein
VTVGHLLDERYRWMDERADCQRHVERTGKQLKPFPTLLPGQAAQVGAEQDRHIEHDEPERRSEPLRAEQRRHRSFEAAGR